MSAFFTQDILLWDLPSPDQIPSFALTEEYTSKNMFSQNKCLQAQLSTKK